MVTLGDAALEVSICLFFLSFSLLISKFATDHECKSSGKNFKNRHENTLCTYPLFAATVFGHVERQWAFSIIVLCNKTFLTVSLLVSPIDHEMPLGQK